MLPFRIEQRQTTPKPGKAPRPVWVVVGMTLGWDEEFRDLGGRRYHGEWSFFEDPTDLLPAAPRTFAERLKAKQDRAAARAKRYEGWADNAAGRSAAALDTAHKMMDAIPLGQPLLVDHYSYKRDLNYRDRGWNKLGKAVAEDKKAHYLRGRAEAAAANADPDHNLGFCIRRRDEAAANVRRMERQKAEYTRKGVSDTPRTDTALAEYRDQRDYWQAKIDALGGEPPKPARAKPDDQRKTTTLKKGDRVWVRVWEWATVVRLNPITVTIQPEKPIFGHGSRNQPRNVPYILVRTEPDR